MSAMENPGGSILCVKLAITSDSILRLHIKEAIGGADHSYCRLSS